MPPDNCQVWNAVFCHKTMSENVLKTDDRQHKKME